MDRMSGFRQRLRTSRWADDESGEEWELDEEERERLLDDLDEEERRRLLGEFPDTSDDEECEWLETEKRLQADGWFPVPRSSKAKKRARQRRRNKARKRQVSDDWMTPFSELLKDNASVTSFPQLRLAPFGPAGAALPPGKLVSQTVGQPLLPPVQPMPSPTKPLLPPSGVQLVVPPLPGQPNGPAVCIWNTTSPSSATTRVDGNPQDIFTNGSQVFQPVPSTSGQPLFTDGKQLYASVCVMLGAPPSGEVRGSFPEPSPEPSTIMESCGAIDEHSGTNLTSCVVTSDEEDWD